MRALHSWSDSMNLRLTSFVVALACLVSPAFASAETLNVKLGLWEITSVTQTRGMPPLPKALLDQLTPEQRRKMEADLKAEQAKGPATDTDRECITQKDLERPFEPGNRKECKETIVTTTRTSQEMHIVCSGPVPGSGVFKIAASSPDKMNGSLDLTLGKGANAMNIKAQLEGRWLSSDCGDEADDDEEGDSDSDTDADADPDADSGR
jgi:hypothetical protein